MDDEWTVRSLKAYVERIFDEREKQLVERHKAMEDALGKATSALDHRLQLLNEFREQSADEQANFVRKDEFDQLEKRYEDRHSQLQLDVRLLQARVVPMLWVGSTLTIGVVTVFLAHIFAGFG